MKQRGFATGCECNTNWYWVWVLCCLMTPGFSKDIWCHVWPCSFLCLQIAWSDIRPHVIWPVSLVIADGYSIFIRGMCAYVWVNILTLSPPRAPTDIVTSMLWHCMLASAWWGFLNENKSHLKAHHAVALMVEATSVTWHSTSPSYKSEQW